MPLDHKPPKVVARKGARKVHCHTSGNKSQITVLVCERKRKWTHVECFIPTNDDELYVCQVCNNTFA